MRDASDSVNLRIGTHLKTWSAQPWAYDFFAVMRRLECATQPQPRWGQALRPSAEAVRVGQEPSMAFAPAAFSRFMPASAHTPPLLRQQFFGYLGPNGPLPVHLSEFIRERAVNLGDPTWLAFLDSFAHRFSLYLYRAWALPRPAVSLDRPDEDAFRGYVGALIGIAGAARRERDEIPDDARLHFSGHLVRRVHSAESVVAVLGRYFGVRVRLEPWVGHWMHLPPGEFTRLGRDSRDGCDSCVSDPSQAARRLGRGAMLGRRAWDRQHRVRLHLGPLTLAQYRTFLPIGAARPALQRWVQQLLGDELYWDARLLLCRTEVPSTRLGQQRGNGPRLGWISWLGARPRSADAGDVRIDGDGEGFTAAVAQRAAEPQPPTEKNP